MAHLLRAQRGRHTFSLGPGIYMHPLRMSVQAVKLRGVYLHLLSAPFLVSAKSLD